jgi:hypothetical protein
MIRIVQAGVGDKRPMVLLFLVGQHLDGQLRESLGPIPCIMADDKATSVKDIEHYIAKAREECGAEISGYVLGGWSAGVGVVRYMVGKASCRPAALVLADGTHASKPPSSYQLDVWKPFVSMARRGDMVVAASHIFNTYVEALPDPYLSTVSVLRLLTDWPLETGGSVDAPIEQHDGDLHVYSYKSSSCDAPAHITQQTHALPMMLERHIRPLLETTTPLPQPTTNFLAGVGGRTLSIGVPPALDVVAWQAWLMGHGFYGFDESGVFDELTKRATTWFQRAAGLEPDGVVGPLTLRSAREWRWPTSYDASGLPTWKDSSLSIGARAVRWSLSWLGRAVEIDGPNRGPLIEAMFSATTRRATGKSLDIRSGEWCAAFFSCASNAALLNEEQPLLPSPSPFPYRAAVIELVEDSKAAGTWLPIDDARQVPLPYMIAEGDGCVLRRGQSEWEGHVCRVLARDGKDGLWTVGGNEGDMVRISRVSLSDPALQGFIRMPS